MNPKLATIALCLLMLFGGQTLGRAADPLDTVRTKSWVIPDNMIRRGDGGAGVRLFNGRFTLHDAEAGQTFLVEFRHANYWQAGDVMLEKLHIVGYDAAGTSYELTYIPYYAIMDHCYYRGRDFRWPGKLSGQRLIDVVVAVRFEPVPIRSRIGRC